MVSKEDMSPSKKALRKKLLSLSSLKLPDRQVFSTPLGSKWCQIHDIIGW